jgi:hypothetical protein
VPRPPAPDARALEEARAFWTGLHPIVLRALERAPLDSDRGFALPERVAVTAAVPAFDAVVAIARVLGADGVAVGADGAFDGATVRAVDAALEGVVPEARGEADAPFVRLAREGAEAAGLIERRKGRVRLTEAGRRLLDDEPDAVLPRLLRSWARRPAGAPTRAAVALRGTWPLVITLLHRFGGRWLPVGFYATAIADMAPTVVAAVTGESDPDDDALEDFAHAFVSEVVLRFAAYFGLVEVMRGREADEEMAVRATGLLEELLPLAVDQAPASAAFEDWDGPRENAAAAVNRDLGAALAERGFETQEELEAFVADFMAERNAAPVGDFDGLSPGSMQRLLYDPFGEASPLVVADVPRVAPRSALLHLALDLGEALGENGLRATAKGNLPRPYVLAAVERYAAAGWGVEEFVKVRGEDDFRDLNVARWVARAAGLVTLRGGRWHATRAYRRTLERSGPPGVYAALFRAFATKYAWNSADFYPRLDIVQTSWAFSLLQLLRHGASPRDGAFYAERFLRAFPMAVDEAAAAGRDRSWPRDPREDVAQAYEVRVLERFAAFLGLAEVERGTWHENRGRIRTVRATPELAEVVAERVV